MIALSALEQIKKRDGRIVPFDRRKISTAIMKAAQAVAGTDTHRAEELTDEVIAEVLEEAKVLPTVEQIQDAIEKVMIKGGYTRTAKAFILYRARRSRIREGKSELLDAVAEILREINPENANVANSPSAKLLQIGGAASKEFYLKRLLPERIADAHIRGELHIHDLEHYAKSPNSFVIPLGKLLTEGFQAGYGFIRPPKRPRSAASLANVILQAAQNDSFGAQCFAHFDRDLARVFKELPAEEELFQAIEGLVYDLNTIYSRVGMQVPFATLNVGLDLTETGRMVTRCLLKAFQNGLGRGESPVFPNITFLLKKGVNTEKEDPNHDLFQLALEVASTRMNPTFANLDAPYNDENTVYFSGCNRIPTPAEGRGNVASVTVNLPRLALKTKFQGFDFFKLLDKALELAISQLRNRLELLSQLEAKDLPFIMGQKIYAASEGLNPRDPIGVSLEQGTLSIGFIGLAEALIALTGMHHGESEETRELGERVLQKMRAAADEASEEYGLNFGLYASQSDSIAGRLLRLDQLEFGRVPGVTSKEYYSNSFHLPSFFPVSPSEKARIEAPFHALCNHGHVSFFELKKGEPARMEEILREAMKWGCGHLAFNLPNDHCLDCGFFGSIAEETCPRCGGEIRRVRRLSGYLAPFDRFSSSKRAELEDRLTQE
ncbi:MAG TPA: anaerobic ribonucleoside-triphosphate reductase [Cyanobacteria bacterium UBA8530]|nr:anaerobic ribonucleoside-triphosphate reductase [Cyanobacteria bacterium UBA8530]